jgi:predicted dinucleotide-binding enzyme
MAKVGVIGSGQVGTTLANGLLKHGYEVMRASRSPEKLGEWKAAAGERAHTGTPKQATQFGDLVVLAVKGAAAEATLDLCGVETLAGKVVIDTTNPIADAPPENGVIKFFTNLDESLMERLQKKAPQAHFVKAFSSVGNALMVDPDFGDIKPTMFICGNDSGAKGKVVELLEAFRWEVEDLGAVEAARAIEPLCMLWCIPGFKRNQWMHAFKLLQK